MSSSSSGDDAIQTFKFRGHSSSVLGLDVSSDENYLLSGSEDQTARLWDLRDQRHRACLCIQTPGEVQTVTFAPSQQANKHPSLSSPFSKNYSVFLGIAHHVVEYDLRQASSPILKHPTNDWTPILQNQDEVNEISMAYFTPRTPKRKSGGSKKAPQANSSPSLFMAAADDAGTIRLVANNTGGGMPTSATVLHHDANGVAVVPTCAFRPNGQKSLELASGGTDCKILLWDVSRPKKPLSVYCASDAPNHESVDNDQSLSRSQVANPPFVHSLAWSPSGEYLAAGLGDGSISVFSTENRSLVPVGVLDAGHESAVASVLFPSFAQDYPRVLATAGNDGAVLCWDLASSISHGDGQDMDPRGLFHSSLIEPTPSTSMNVSSQMTELSISDRPRILFGIPHGEKPNWMVSTKSPATIFIADTTCDITAYKIPTT